MPSTSPLPLMLVRPVLTTEIPRTKDGMVDFEALGLKDSILPTAEATYRGFPMPEPTTNVRGQEVCGTCHEPVVREAGAQRSSTRMEMHVVHHGSYSVPEMEDVPLEDALVFRDAMPMDEDDVEYIEMAPLPLPCGSGGAYAKPKKVLHPIPENEDQD